MTIAPHPALRATLSPLTRGEGSRRKILRPAKRGEEPALSERSESKGAAERRMRGAYD